MTSPDSGAIKNVSAKSVKFADNKLSVDVPSLSGGYAGTLRNGVFEGEWTQEGAKLPLSLAALRGADADEGGHRCVARRMVRPVQSRGPQRDDRSALQHRRRRRAARRTRCPGARSEGLAGLRRQARRWALPRRAGASPRRDPGQLKGDQIVGEWNQLGNSSPLTLKKGKYVAAANYLDFPAAARDQVKGKLERDAQGLTVVARFETDAQGRTLGYFDSPTTEPAEYSDHGGQARRHQTHLRHRRLRREVHGRARRRQADRRVDQARIAKPLPLMFTRGEKSAAAPIVQDLTPEAAAPYLGLYWDESRQRPQIVVLYKGRLELELPWRTVRELEKTTEEHVWSYVVKPENFGEFHRDGAGPATAMTLRQSETTTLPRFEPEKGLPSRRVVCASTRPTAREEARRAGTIRMTGNIERSTSPEKGSFELLSAGTTLSPGAQTGRRRGPGSRGWQPGLDAAPAFVASSRNARGNGQSDPTRRLADRHR